MRCGHIASCMRAGPVTVVDMNVTTPVYTDTTIINIFCFKLQTIVPLKTTAASACKLITLIFTYRSG